MPLINLDIVNNILTNYFDKTQITEFKEIVTRSIKSKKKFNPSIPLSEKKQLASEFTRENSNFLYIDLLLTYAADKLSKPKLIELMLYIGESCTVHGELEIASQTYLNILSTIKDEDNLENIAAHSLLALGEIYSRQAQWDKSINYINQAKRSFDKQKDFKGIAKCNNMLGTIYGDRGKIQKAKECFENSLSFLNPQTDNALIGMIDINLGILNSMQGNYDKSFVFYQRALINYGQVKDVMRISQLRHNLGMLYTQKEEYTAALREFDRSIATSIKAGFLPNLALSYLSKAYVYIKTNDLPLATAFADKSLDFCLKINDRLSIADIYKIKGMIERKHKHFDVSESYFLTSLRINTELDNTLNNAETLYELGELYIDMNKKDEAIKCLKKTLRYYQSLKADVHIKRVKNLINKIR